MAIQNNSFRKRFRETQRELLDDRKIALFHFVRTSGLSASDLYTLANQAHCDLKRGVEALIVSLADTTNSKSKKDKIFIKERISLQMKEFADLVPGSYDKQNSNKELPDSWMGLGSSSWSTPSQVFHWGYDDYGYVTCAGILLNRNYELAHFLVKSASAWIEIKNKPSEVEDFLKEQGKDYTKLKQRVLAGKGWLSKNLRE